MENQEKKKEGGKKKTKPKKPPEKYALMNQHFTTPNQPIKVNF